MNSSPAPFLESTFGSALGISDYSPMDIDQLDFSELLETKVLESDKILHPVDNKLKQLKQDLIDFSNEDWDEINREIKKKSNHQDKKEFSFQEEKNRMDSFKEKLEKISKEYKSLELNLKSSFEKSKILERKVSDFTEFINEFQESNKDKDCVSFKEALYEFTVLYNDDNNLRENISKFIDKREELTQLLDISRTGQQILPVPTCPLCLSNPLDSFIDPCGHTGCRECLVRSIQSNNINMNCALCRKAIHSIKPLFIL